MEKKFKFSDKNAVSKIVYLTVIAILCISAIVIGIVAANSRRKNEGSENPQISDGTSDSGTDNQNPNTNEGGAETDENKNPTLTFVSPAVGTVIKSHSATVPVFSNTLEEWRIHTGIDISTADGGSVLAAADGEISGIYNDPMFGQTVEITHSSTHKSYYSNLSRDNLECKLGDKVFAGEVIGYVGDTAICEIADEPHLHFELKVSGESVNPLDYISEESKLVALGIISGQEA